VGDLSQIIAELDSRPPASDAAIAECETQLGLRLPSEYKQFHRLTDGAEGFVRLWAVGELAQFNERYEVQRNAPGLLLFGSDGCGDAFGFDTRSSPWAIVQVPFVGMEWAVARPLGTSFYAFLRELHRRESEQ